MTIKVIQAIKFLLRLQFKIFEPQFTDQVFLIHIFSHLLGNFNIHVHLNQSIDVYVGYKMGVGKEFHMHLVTLCNIILFVNTLKMMLNCNIWGLFSIDELNFFFFKGLGVVNLNILGANIYNLRVPFHNFNQFGLPLCRDIIIFCSDNGKQSLVRKLRKLYKRASSLNAVSI